MQKQKLPWKVSICVPVYNEADNIGPLLDSIFSEYIPYQTIIILSGCTDGSEEVVERYVRNYSIHMYKQNVRGGKPSAINLFLQKANGDIVLIVNSDVVLEKNCLFNMLLPFNDPSIGMVGVHPSPLKNSNGIVYLMNEIIWELHHWLNKYAYKFGEVIGFRNVIQRMPNDVSADEVYIEYEIKKRGYKLCYMEDAIVYNRGPVKIKDLFWQRVRVFWGHLDIKRRFGYRTSSMEHRLIIISLLRYIQSKPYMLLPLLFLCLIESIARLVAIYRYYFVDIYHPYIWDKYEK